MHKRNNILICANDVTQIGGISRVIHAMADGFSDRGYSVSLLGMNSVDREKSYTEQSNRADQYEVIIPYTDNPPSRKQNLEKWSRMRGEAVGYLRRYFENVDLSDTIVIILQVYVMEHLKELDLPIGGDEGLAVLGMYHNSFKSCKDIGDLRRVKAAYSDINRFYALTEGDRDMFACEGMTNASYMYNPVELLSRPPVVPFAKRPKRAVYVGRFAKEKNVPKLVRAWAAVAKDYPEWSFDIYGVGPDESNIAREIFESGCTDSVSLLGPTQNPEVVFSEARLMLMGSDFEGLPVAIVEAGLCGTPSLVTDCCPGMSVLIEDRKTGLIARDQDMFDFESLLREYLENDTMGLSYSSAVVPSMERFSIEKIIDAWEKEFALLGIGETY